MRYAFISICAFGLLFFFSNTSFHTAQKAEQEAVLPTLSKIAFGSCNKMNLSQDMWPAIAANKPDMWIWLGDIIYADTPDMRALRGMYMELKKSKGYQQLLQGGTTAIGVYDDHDYGHNDAGKSYPMKKGSKNALMNFLDVPQSAAVRKRAGAYQSYLYGNGKQQIKIIVLDTRYFRDTLIPDSTSKRRYFPNTTGTILGNKQWKWLSNELKNSSAALNIICSSIQILSDDHNHEKWGNFPNERRKFFATVVESKAKNVLVLSGDRHMVDISKVKLPTLNYPLYDFTSSGLTHTRRSKSEVNKFREGDMIVKRNFGVLDITWNGNKPVVSMQARGIENRLYQEIVVRYP